MVLSTPPPPPPPPPPPTNNKNKPTQKKKKKKKKQISTHPKTTNTTPQLIQNMRSIYIGKSSQRILLLNESLHHTCCALAFEFVIKS